MKFKWQKPAIFIALLALSLVVFGRNLNDFFVSDDFDWLELTQQPQTGLMQKLTGNYYGLHGQGGTFRPLVNIVFSLESKLFGLNPLGYHAFSIALHAGTAFLIYLIFLVLFKDHKDKEPLALLAAIIFVVIPSHAEAVIWIAAVGDPMATVFYLLSLYSYLLFRTKNQELRTKYLFFSILFFIFSLLSKETAITLPFVLFGYEIFIESNLKLKSLISNLGPWFLVLGSYLAYRYWAIGLLFGYYARASLLSVASAKLYAHSLIDFISGVLIFDAYRLIAVHLLSKFWYILAALLIFYILFLIRSFSKRQFKNHIFLFYFWFVNIALVLPLGMSKLNDEGERYSYLASVAVAVGISWSVLWLWKRWKIVGALAGAAGAAYFTVFLNLKSIRWEGASLVSENIVAGLSDLDFESYKKTYFIGMPDNYEGAQVMRNGIIQAIKLNAKSPNSKLNAERVPIYTVLNKVNAEARILNDFDALRNGIHTTTVGNKFLLTGNATEKHDDYYFELWGYDYSKNLSYTIHLVFDPSLVPDWQEGKLQVVYYDEGELKSLRNQKISELEN